MTVESPAAVPRLSPHKRSWSLPDYDGLRRAGFGKRLQRILLLVAALLGVALIALLDLATDAHLFFSILYLLPATACAWCCGFSDGVLLSLAGAVAWCLVDRTENPALSQSIAVWNGVIRFGTLALMSSLVSRLRVSILRERLLARTDPLTGAANGRTFYETAQAEVERARRGERPLTLAYFDLDDFKKLNDRLGHAAGDEALRCVVQTIQLYLRNADLLARLGGDEFALLLPETDAAGASALLARLQEQLARELKRNGWPVTLSVGAVTFLRPLADIDVMGQRVDALMYSAKRNGKGRVEHAVLTEAEALADPNLGIDRRATTRTLSNRTARIRHEAQDGEQQEFAAVRDVSADGISLRLELRIPEDTVLVVEPLSSGARTLLARVRYAKPESGGWRHGCELSNRLSAEELSFWLGGSEAEEEGGMRKSE